MSCFRHHAEDGGATADLAACHRNPPLRLTTLPHALVGFAPADGEAFKAWGGKVLPTSVLVDRSGVQRYTGLGPLEWDEAQTLAVIEQLLKENHGDDRRPGDD